MDTQSDMSFFVIQVDHLHDMMQIDFNSTFDLAPSETLSQVTFLELIISSIYSFLFICGLVSNIYVIVFMSSILYRLGGAGRLINIVVYILCLAILNLIITFSMPIAVIDMLTGQWPLPNLMCPLYWTLEMLNKTMSSMIVALVALSCYFAVCRPQSKLLYRNCPLASLQIILGFSLVSWNAQAIFNHYDVYYVIRHPQIETNSSTLIHFGKKCLFQTADNDSTQTTFTMSSFTLGYILPVGLILICYTLILKQVYYWRQGRSNSNNRLLRNPIRNRRFYQTAKSVSRLVLFHLCTWTPYWCVNVPLHLRSSSTSLDQDKTTDTTQMVMALISHLMPFVNCAFAPLLYTLSNRQIRNLYKKTKTKRGT